MKKFRAGGSGIVFGVLLITFFGLMFTASSVEAKHTSAAELQPEWSPAGENINYTVTLCNNPTSVDKIDEVRIYQNPDYTNFIANEKTGWFLGSFNPVKKYYPLTSLSSSYYIDPNKCENTRITRYRTATVRTLSSTVFQRAWTMVTRNTVNPSQS
ncbi:MAG: hypothetical protein ISS93_03840 [Candidatus Aenigmarchaeota archaeon]|nr:hypothetical protein [Candidatus Aenigmarchaeota archaeon]